MRADRNVAATSAASLHTSRDSLTTLPDWSPPSGHYSLHCRQRAWELLHQADSTSEQSGPDVADASRIARRIYRKTVGGGDACRLLRALLATKLWQATGWSVSIAPIMLALDWTAIRRFGQPEIWTPIMFAIRSCGFSGATEKARRQHQYGWRCAPWRRPASGAGSLLPFLRLSGAGTVLGRAPALSAG